jgi:hypothetical protein
MNLPNSAGEVGKNGAAQVGKPRVNHGIGKSRVDRLVELINDISVRLRGCSEANPVVRLIAWKKIRHCWDIGQRVRAHSGGHRQRAHLTGPDVLDRLGYPGEENLHLPAEQR